MFEEIRDPAARVRALCEYGSQLTEVDMNIPVGRYFRSGKEMIRMAEVYQDEGCHEKAFILYSKFVTLFVEKLPKHPGYQTATSSERTTNKKLVNAVFPKAETIKKKLNAKYASEEEKRRAEEKVVDEMLTRETELRKREEKERLEEEEKSKDHENRRWQELEEKMLQESAEKLCQMKEMQENERRKAQDAPRPPPLSSFSGSSVSSVFIGSQPPIDSSQTSHLPPPPSYRSVVSTDFLPNVPDRTLKPSSPMNSTFNVDEQNRPFVPTVDRSLKPSHFTSVGDSGFKMVYVPDELVPKFLRLAQSNTSKSVETCGILCGKLAHSTWRITHLIVPHQHGKSDSCDITNEEDLVEYQDEHELITLGWIHTHPTQTAFLSSVDQHTHWPYQKLLPEAIAIVCAPKFHETGYFYLTPDYGMDMIRSCTGKGFHEHPKIRPIFETCPHVHLDSSATVTVIDLRRNT